MHSHCMLSTHDQNLSDRQSVAILFTLVLLFSTLCCKHQRSGLTPLPLLISPFSSLFSIASLSGPSGVLLIDWVAGYAFGLPVAGTYAILYL